ncbi:hypothetical protein [Micromonospora sp. RTP1Z1]|uniref:hypothetical protein n=1 Tax=Micromonospora sp. RTP1Z1 TaxID=2994043 RepID=UPI0029C989AE|nr:hypothetical protein [Micromonospora sp. RTP1Z1]
MTSKPAAAASTEGICPVDETRASAALPAAWGRRAAISALVPLPTSTSSAEPVPSSRPLLPVSSTGMVSPPATRSLRAGA